MDHAQEAEIPAAENTDLKSQRRKPFETKAEKILAFGLVTTGLVAPFIELARQAYKYIVRSSIP